MGNYKIEDEKRTTKQRYLDYIDRCIRTTNQTRLDIHKLLNTQNIGKYYGLSQEELDEIGKELEEENGK